MSVVLRDPRIPPPHESTWPTFQTLKTAQCVISNIALEKFLAKRPCTLLLNTPLRIWSCIQIYNKDKRSNEDYRDIAFDVASVVALFFPGGRKAAIVLDIFSEVLRICFDKPKPPRRAFTFKAVMGRDPLDCSVYENALKCLGLTEEEAKDKAKLDDRYQKSASHMVERIDWFKERQHPFLNLFELMLQETESAYRTLIDRLHNEDA